MMGADPKMSFKGSGGSGKGLNLRSDASVFSTIVKDHACVRDLWSKFKAATYPEERARLAGLIIREVSQHSFLEENVVYPEFEKRLGDTAGKLMHKHSTDEHDKVKMLLFKLDTKITLEVNDPDFLPTLEMAMKDLDHHMEEEESKFLPQLQEKMTLEEEIELGKSWNTKKMIAPTHVHPDAPSSGGIMHTLAGAAFKPVDVALDALRYGTAKDPSEAPAEKKGDLKK